MKANRLFATLALTGLMIGTAACSQQTPSTVPHNQAATTRNVLAADQVNLPLIDQDKLNIDGQAVSMKDIQAKLPARISAADADKLLVKVDGDKIAKTEKTYSVSLIYSPYFYRGYYPYTYGTYGYPYTSYYYPYSSYYFPYYYNAGYYYPYSSYSYSYPYSYSYSPFLYNYSSLYYPYYYRRLWY